MRLGIVSDTHGHLANTRKAAAALAEHGVDLVIHCGDIDTPEIVPLFDRWPAHFVFGNCDNDQAGLDRAIRLAGQTSHGAFAAIELEGCPVAFLHGHEHRRFRETIASQAYRLVCYGHTHVAEHHREGETLVLNPGALYRADRHTVAVVELPALDVTSLHVD